jgi:hypothetical protein
VRTGIGRPNPLPVAQTLSSRRYQIKWNDPG